MEWISVEERLPEIPKGKYGISILVAIYDHVYDEINPGRGYDVHEGYYGKLFDRNGNRVKNWEGNTLDEDFMQLCTNGEWFPYFDEITHWMYLPEPPKYNKGER